MQNNDIIPDLLRLGAIKAYPSSAGLRWVFTIEGNTSRQSRFVEMCNYYFGVIFC